MAGWPKQAATALGALALALALALAAAPAANAAWYAGDGHVHTCYSHDAYCGPLDDNTGPETFYSFGGDVDQRFREASLKGLDFVTISDHDDVRAQSDPAYGAHGVAGLPAYEASLPGGHAHLLGATRLYPKGDTGTAAGVRALADAVRADAGRFQANHPTYKTVEAFESCEQADSPNPEDIPLHWRYGFSVRPDSIEVWNATTLIQPAEIYWECWLQRGVRVGATAGSDSHGATQPNLAMPTTWVSSSSTRPGDLLAAIGAGRTTLSRNPPAFGGTRLLIEGDADRDGTYEAAIGDQVPPGTPLRVRADGGAPLGFVRVRANGRTVVEGEPLAPGGAVQLTAPRERGWARAVLYLADGTQAVDPGCRPVGQPLDTCTRDLAIAAMTSPIYVGAPGETAPLSPGPATAPSEESDEPDDDPALPPAQQSNGAAPLPDVPRARTRGFALKRLTARARRCPPGRRSARVRIAWSGADRPVQVQRKLKRRWRTIRRAATGSALRTRAPCRRATAFRARTAPRGLRPSRWRHARVRPR